MLQWSCITIRRASDEVEVQPGFFEGEPVATGVARALPNDTPRAELRKLTRYRPLVIEEVPFIPWEPEAANRFFSLVSSCYDSPI